ncbi:MAG: prepilin-type N-terminal cleavage/methylation domain-containing protein [Deltaproteobacteria bacterium]|nr:prepilin-type N-terminal cleavage/methylation domain-containing protein [Deltaproteobacteria bacterium]MCB9788158.1 prepilin-type N-terminal cleavage/methylation domain-containing protein [Deltaproteobacteria bacterium]
MTPRRRAGGFTLIELMVAVLVGTIVAAGIYLMYAQSAKGYRIQNQTLDALGELRTAARQVRADLRSAGYNAPVQSVVETWVIPPTGVTLTAVVVEADPDIPVAVPTANENIAPQRIRLLGDFWSQQVYTAQRVAGTEVQIEWNPAARSAGGDGDEDDFRRIFATDRMLRIEGYGVARREQIIPISSVTWNGPGELQTINLTDTVTAVGGFGSGSEISVIGYRRYRLANDVRRDTDSLKYDLIREDLDPTGAPIDGSALIVAENMVDLQVYDLCLNVTAPDPATMQQVPVQIQCFPTLADLEASGRTLDTTPANASHLLRSMTVKLAARTPYEDETVPFAPRPSVDEPLRAFELDPAVIGAARVFEMGVMTALTSIQARRQ